MKQDIDLKKVIKILIKRIWIIGCLSVVGLISAFIFSSYIIQPLYISTTSLYVESSQEENGGAGKTLTDLQYAERIVNTYAFILKNKAFLSDVASNINLGYTGSQIRQMLQINGIKSTEVFQISVTNKNPEHAKIIAEEIARMAPAELKRVVNSGSVQVIDAATVPQSPSYPNVRRYTATGFLLGLAISVVIIFLIEILDTTVKGETDLTENYGLPVLGAIPTIEAKGKGV